MSKPGNSKYVKKLNRMRILNIVKEHEPISRQQLSELTGLTPPAITGIIRELIAMRFIKEVGLGESQGGRKPIKLKFNCKAGYVIGVEITCHETVFAVADLKNKPQIICSEKIDMHSPQTGMSRLVAILREIMKRPELKRANFMAIGVAFPSLFCCDENIVKRAINLGPEWNDYPIKDVLEKELALPVVVENNSKAAALAQKWFGTGNRYRSLAYLNLGEGISAGFVLDDSIVQGASGYAGQIGHRVVAENGPLCNCGNRGCLEAVCAIPAILHKVKAELPLIAEQDPLSQRQREKGEIEFVDIAACAAVEGSYAHLLFEQTGRQIGLAVADIVNFYNPEAIFIGGKMTAAGKVLLDAIIATVMTHSFPEISRSTQISLSQLGADSGVIGACALVLQQLLMSPESPILDDPQVKTGVRKRMVYWQRSQTNS